MKIEYLEGFRLVASLKSISRAAALSHISQPALSQQIQRLEEMVGMQLLKRSNKGVELTEAGVIVEKYAIHIIKIYDNLMEDIENLQRSTGTVRIVASPVVGIYGLPCSMFKVKERFPQYSFRLSTATSLDVERQVAKGESDIGFIIGKPKGDSLKYQKVYSGPVMLVCSDTFKVKDTLSMAELKKQPIALISTGSFRHQLDKYFRNIDLVFEDFNILFNLDSVESVKSSVLQGHGLAFLPYLAIKKEIYLKQLREVKIDGFDMNFDVNIVYKGHSDAEHHIYDLSRYFEKVVPETFC